MFDPDKKIKDYTPEEYDLLMYAESQKITTADTGDMNVTYEGIVSRFMRTKRLIQKEKLVKNRQKQLKSLLSCTPVQAVKEKDIKKQFWHQKSMAIICMMLLLFS